MLAILQLDAISRPIVERMLGEGRLPTLAGLSARGEWRKLRTPATYYTGATHPTLYSGVELGEHSQYYLFQWSPEEQRIRYRRSFDAPELVWERLARSGRRTLAIDPYEGVPPRGPAGVVLSGVQFFNFLGSSGLRRATPGEPFGGSAAAAPTRTRSSASRGSRACCRSDVASLRRRAGWAMRPSVSSASARSTSSG